MQSPDTRLQPTPRFRDATTEILSPAGVDFRGSEHRTCVVSSVS